MFPPPPPAQPAVAVPARRRPTRVGRIVAALVITAWVALASQQAGELLHDSSVQHPARWDPRVVDLVHFVETARGHRFRHPVPVYFLSPAAYRKAAQGGGQLPEPTAADRRDSEDDAAELRAFGMLQGDPDLLAASNELADTGTLAFYDQHADIVNVRGHVMSVSLRVTLVHELTHALQDQTFDVARLLATHDSERATAVRAVIEGDATAVEHRYVATLPDADQQAYERESGGQADRAESGLQDVPDVLTTFFGLPYALGSSFVDLVDADRGGVDLTRADSVFGRMPDSTAELFTAQDYFDDVRTTRVAAPKVEGRRGRDDSLGAGFLFVMLSERTDAATAMAAVDGWRGDRYASAIDPSRGARCVAATVDLATPADGQQLRDALGSWAAAMPAAADARVGGRGDRATVRTCDPGKHADVGLTGKSADALAYPVVRNELAAAQVLQGEGRRGALCVADQVVTELTPQELAATELTDELQAKLSRLIAGALATC
jgi:hypothetical protein